MRQTRTIITELANRSDYTKFGPYRAFFVEMTPWLATEILDNLNTHNRAMKNRRSAFARDMLSGDWTFNGDTICFSKDGVLRDGQNRLSAIVASGTTQIVLVVIGLEPEAQDTMDQGVKRTVGDVLHLAGEDNANILAAVVANLVTLKKGLAWARSMSSTTSETRRFVEENPEVRDAVLIASRARNVVAASPSAIGAAYFLCAEKNRDMADEFFQTKLIDRIGLSANDPARTLALKFENLRNSPTARRFGNGAKVRLDADETIRYCLLAWNHYRAGNQISKLQAPKGGWNKDNFPEPR